VRVEAVPALLQLAALPFKIVELTVHNDVDALIFVGDGLIARGKSYVKRAWPNHTWVGREPNALSLQDSMDDRFRTLATRLRNASASSKTGCNSALC
jgi:hypothetical protein